MKTCAFCDLGPPFTKEHIWPRGLISRFNEELLTFNKHINGHYKGDPLIKDVCQNCNNVKLIALDSYLCQLYDNHIGKIINSGEDVAIKYDYDLLLRGLLKISYNSARTQKHAISTATHKRYSKYILNGEYCPKTLLRLQIVTSSKVLDPEDGSSKLIEPGFLRCADIKYEGLLNHRFMIRMVAINSFWFFIIMSHRNESANKWKQFLANFNTSMRLKGVLVNPKAEILNIRVSQTTYIHPNLLGSLV
ncbi:MAG: hypothetical protein AAGA80_26480 [Cyanobacteria bacterium P01_F01_bin.143]